jgi:hypothetical protein
MKKTYSLSLTALSFVIIAISCSKKDNNTPSSQKSFTTLTRSDIQTYYSSLSSDPIPAEIKDSVYFKKGDVYVYQTKSGKFGKLKIDTVDIGQGYAVTIDATTYALDGSVLKQTSNLTIYDNLACNLDSMTQTSELNTEADFLWDQSISPDIYLTPYNGASSVNTNSKKRNNYSTRNHGLNCSFRKNSTR